MKIGLVSCVRLGRECLEEIYAFGGKIDVLVTLDDKVAPNKSGRVVFDDFCHLHGIDLRKVRHINDDPIYDDLARRKLDWLFIIGWSQLVAHRLIELPRRGCIGMHPTLLPQGRGRAPIPWAILNKLERTGVSVFRIAEGTDDGPICAQVVVDIAPRETATTLYEKVCAGHRACIREIWPKLMAETIDFIPQDESEASYWPQRKPEDGELDARMSVESADRLVRAVSRPYPGAWMRQDDRVIRIWSGHPEKVGPSDRGVLIKFSDGTFRATDFEIE